MDIKEEDNKIDKQEAKEAGGSHNDRTQEDAGKSMEIFAGTKSKCADAEREKESK